MLNARALHGYGTPTTINISKDTCKVGFKNPFLIRISETVIGLEDNKHFHEECCVSVVESLRYYFLLYVVVC